MVDTNWFFIHAPISGDKINSSLWITCVPSSSKNIIITFSYLLRTIMQLIKTIYENIQTNHTWINHQTTI
jgi:hypothetical protein